MGPSVRLFQLFGVQFTANWSWVPALGLVIYTASVVFGAISPRWPMATVWVLATVAGLLTAASLYAHELAHALVAIRFGVPVRTISLFLLGGMAHITREAPSPRAELLIGVAGPAASLLVGLIGAGLGLATWSVGRPLAVLGYWVALTNLPLAVFNLLPAYPLDGGRVLRAIVWVASGDRSWGTSVAARAGQLVAVGLFAAGLLGIVSGGRSELGAIWLIVLAWFMYAGAAGARRAATVREALRRLPVAAVMQRQIGQVQAEDTLEAVASAYPEPEGADGHGIAGFGVYRDDQLVGLVTALALRRVPVGRQPGLRVEHLMQPIDARAVLQPDAPAAQAFQLMLDEGLEQVAVVAEGRLLGLVGQADLTRVSGR